VRRGLVAAALIAPALLLVAPAMGQAPAPASGPGWNQLTAAQRDALAPLAGQWSTIPPESKRKWLEIADKYPRLSPDGQSRMQARMADYARLTPEQRRTARENFQRAYELPRDKRESAVQQYQSLPDDRKKELTERSQRRDVVRPGQKQ
jgi:Spy/CpxP family protein refolding chaperone